MIKQLTSITMHTTSEGQRLSYTYSEIDETEGVIISENNRESRIVLDIESNSEVMAHIEGVKSYVEGKLTE